MNRLFLTSILFCFAGFIYGQNQKVLDISNGGVSIKGVEVVKNESNNFIVLCNTNLEFCQIVLNAGKKDIVVVNDLSTPEKSLFTEETTKNTDLKKDGDKIRTIFNFENGHNYQILHNKKTWNLKVRKKGYSNSDLYLTENKLHVGDSCLQLRDTIHLTFPDSILIRRWDTNITLIKNGKVLTDSLFIDIDDKSCYFTKINLSSDTVLCAKDTLCININKRKYVLVCDEIATENSKIWIFVITTILLLLLFLVCLKFRKKIISLCPFLKDKKVSAQESSEETPKDDLIEERKKELFNELDGLINNLLKSLPKQVNGLEKKKLFKDKKNIEDIISSIEIIEATNKRERLEKCKKIRECIQNIEAILTDDTSIQSSKEEIETEKLADNDVKSDIDFYMEPLSIIEPLEMKESDKEECVSKETIDKVRGSLVALGEQIEEKIRNTKEQEKTLVNQEWQKKFDELSTNYTELQNSYNEDLLKAKNQAKIEAKEELKENIAELERKVEDAEAKAKDAVDTKETAVNEAIRKEKEAHQAETLRLQKAKKDAEEKAENAEKTKSQAVDDAVRKEKALHEKTEKELKDAKEKAEKNFKEKSLSLEKSQKELLETKTDRDKRVIEVKQLKIAQEEYTNSLERVPFAEQYSKQILKIMELGGKIQTSAYSLLDSNVEDPYFIMKALSKYGKMIDGINMVNFYTDINLASKAKFILKDSFLAKFKEDNKDIDSIMRSYFFNQYLEKYINSIMVLNESMCGLKLLLPELQTKVGCFEQYRNELLELAKKLKINVLYVKVGDMAGVNIDLKPTAVDVEIGKPGQILEIQNCIVYQSDKSKPQTRINVTIKK